MRELPFGLKPFCIVAILFGALGLLGNALGLVSLIVNQNAAAPAGGGTRQAELQAEYQRRLLASAKEMRPVHLILLPAVFLTSGLLLAAGVSGLKLQALGFVRTAFAVSLLADSASSAFGVVAQMKTMETLSWFLRESAGGSGTSNPALVGMRVGIMVGLTVGVGWLLLKIGFYVAGLVYFGKRSVREVFSPPQEAL
jgi:hypothetical protein